MQLVDRPNGTFTTQELARLAVYRDAVSAGFYTDWDGSATTMDTEVLAGLSRASAGVDGDGYPFTADEQQHLERLKVAIAEPTGRYADDLPPGVSTAGHDDAGQLAAG
jgi:hypothetical protein